MCATATFKVVGAIIPVIGDAPQLDQSMLSIPLVEQKVSDPKECVALGGRKLAGIKKIEINLSCFREAPYFAEQVNIVSVFGLGRTDEMEGVTAEIDPVQIVVEGQDRIVAAFHVTQHGRAKVGRKG
jgi:hypothetical protein